MTIHDHSITFYLWSLITILIVAPQHFWRVPQAPIGSVMWRGWDGISICHRNRSSLMIPQTCWDHQTARALHRLVRLKGVYLLDKTSKRVKFLLRRSAIIFHLMWVVGIRYVTTSLALSRLTSRFFSDAFRVSIRSYLGPHISQLMGVTSPWFFIPIQITPTALPSSL